MYHRTMFCFLLSIGLTVNAQTINLRGKVANQAGKPVVNAIVSLVSNGLKDTTGADGAYSIVQNNVAVIPFMALHNKAMSLNGAILEFSLPEPSPVKVETFDVDGSLLKKQLLRNAPAGFHRFNIATGFRTEKLVVIRVSISRNTTTFRYLPLSAGKYAQNSSLGNSATAGGKIAKTAAIADTLKIIAANYIAKATAITSYDQQLDITLDTAVAGSTGSLGCGKALSALKSGKYEITSAGLKRKYTIDIPANYDPNKPYRVIFGMHCMGSSMEGVVSEKYYSLKPLADNAKVPVIFVAPHGYTDNSPWRVSDNKDHIFFGDMLKLFKEELCVDTTRIFCCGFSYGAMVSYSLSLGFAKELRAVATYAPANWNIWLPTNSHLPIAYYQTTGTADDLCKWVNNDSRKEGGKYCVLQHVEDNGCTVPSTIPTATSGKHVSTEFAGCKEGYPVKFSSHNGGHSGTASDQGSSENWVAKETWEFFMRF